MKKIPLFLFLIISIGIHSQKIPAIKFVVEKGKFIFDKNDFLRLKKETDEAKKSLKKSDSLQKLYPSNNSTYIDDRILYHARFNYSGSKHWTSLLTDEINLSENSKKGENTFCIIIDKTGKPIKFYADKITDKVLYKQVEEIFKTDKFKNWEPADFYGIKVEYIFKFKLIIDDDFTNYDLKNKWARETDTNLVDFGGI
ncbi:hypothetical protein GCM10023210_40640 [Chryseobacterium ginsengisoli]|uniref:TonB C-terminal domain-containing protein n=1 Tax=Chryseobacterium ginsengisoli TaxID=363853 RepID=A0ABP9MT01_9FLAO